jgi:hypothetical protein
MIFNQVTSKKTAIVSSAFLQYHKQLFYFAFLQLKNKEVSEEVVARTFVQFLNSINMKTDDTQTADSLYQLAQINISRRLNRFKNDRVLSAVFAEKQLSPVYQFNMMESQVIALLCSSD